MYSLSEIRVWSNSRGILGFEVNYQVPSHYTGYEPAIKMFGSAQDVSAYKRVEFDQQINGEIILKGDGKLLR